MGIQTKQHDVLRIGAFYEILGISPSCSTDQARKVSFVCSSVNLIREDSSYFTGLLPTGQDVRCAIRRLLSNDCHRFHPDKNPDADRAKFALINRAFEVVKDPESRAKYDLTERVRHALREGVRCRIYEDDGEVWDANLFIGPAFTVLYWQGDSD